MQKNFFLKSSLLLFLIILNFIIIFYYFFLTKEKNHKVIFLDVGQGNGTLIQTKEGKNILIDSGFEQKGISNLSKELGFFDKNLDIIFLTHYDRDHGGKIPFLMDNFFVKLFLDSGVKNIDGSQKKLFDQIKKKYIEKNIFKEKTLSDDWIFLEKDIKIKILFPFFDFDLEDMKSNNRSLAIQIFLDNYKILITGDLPQKYEKLLVEKYGKSLQSDILVAGHHGSKNSSSDIFLQAVSPKYFIISSGKNSYGHPTEQVLESAKKVDAKILRNDKIGNIKFTISVTGGIEKYKKNLKEYEKEFFTK